MSHVFCLLSEMRGRLGMYIGTTSLTRLVAFLRGYDYAIEKLSGEKSDPFLSDFRDWIHERFQTSQHSWEETILLHSADEADAIRHFWELLDEFVKERQGAAPSPDARKAQVLDANGAAETELGSRAGPFIKPPR